MDKKDIVTFIILLIFLSSLKNVVPQIKSNLSKIKNMKEDLILLNKKNQELDKQIKIYDKKIKSLEDTFEKEKLARNMLKMSKSNEVIYKYVETDDKNTINNDNKSEKLEEKK